MDKNTLLINSINAINIRKEIYSLSEEAYREFQIKLLPGTKNYVGVRLPKLRSMAKRIVRVGAAEYLAEALPQKEEELFEEIMLQGMVIGYMKADISDIFAYTEKFVPKINNWAVCDSFCSGFKHVNENEALVWDWLYRFHSSDKEFIIRYGVVMLLNYYIKEQYIDRLFLIFDGIRQEGYYVKMAVAWAVSICYIKYPQETMKYLRENKLDLFTYNKTIQKITESRCVSPEDKMMLRKMKR